MTQPQRVAIIGAGPSGLSQLRAFQVAESHGGVNPEVVCFEKQDYWGGLWNYTWKTGVDEYGLPIHCSMYRNLWSNGPKECLEFADYTFDEHFGHHIGSFPPRAVVFDYIKGRVQHTGIRGLIRFKSIVTWVDYSEETKRFTVKVFNLAREETYEEEFDYVVVATGHFSIPNLPTFKGFQEFNGRILHSHDFRDALEFVDQDVLIIGSNYSAEDIGSQCYKFGARSITISHRTRPTGRTWPSNWKEVPMLTRVEDKVAFFSDGTSTRVDSIILCTGYLHNFPFLPDNLRLKTTNRLWLQKLYKGVFWVDNPKLMYLGMQDQYYTFTMFDAQAWYARDVMLGRRSLPSKDDMDEYCTAWGKLEEALNGPEDEIAFQGDYVKDLLEGSDYPAYDVDAVNAMFVAWEQDKCNDIMGYRDKAFRSPVTGKMSSTQKISWLDEFDDSLVNYLSSANATSAEKEKR